MKISVLIASILWLTISVLAQDEPFYITSGKALKNADSLIELSEYDLARTFLSDVNENDTAFTECQYKLAYINYLDSSYERCTEICKRNIEEDGEFNDDFYNLMGLSFSNRENYDEAIKIFKEAISKYPTYYIFHYNMANAYKSNEQYEKAVGSYKTAVILNPFYSSCYFQLGFLMGSARNTTAASMAFHMYLLLNPNGSSAGLAISNLNEVMKNEQEWDEIDVGDEAFPDYFSEIDIILENKVALNSKYKLKTDLDYQLMRQTQVMIEKIPEIKDTSFWHQHLARYLSLIWTSKKFKGYSYYILDGLNNEEVQAMLKKKKSELIKFREWALADAVPEMYYKLIKDKKDYITIRSVLYKNNVLYGRGKYDWENKVNIGEWTYYHSNSRITSHGSYVNGERNGLWEFYYKNGVIQESGNYDAGELKGEYLKYNKDGILVQKYNYNAESLLEGIAYFYTDFGCLKEESTFKEGKRVGTTKLYYDKEHLKGNSNYKEGKRHGPYFELFYSGDTSEVCYIGEKGYYEGIYKSFWDGNILYAQGKYVEGDKDGYWNYYYRNGNKMKEGSYKLNKTIGKWKEYYEDGTLKSEKFLDESGKENGEVKKYDFDGKLYEMYTYKTGVIMAYKFFNKNGELADSYDKKSNELEFVGYNPLGTIAVEGKFVREGRDGNWKFYDANGILYEESNYKDGFSEGEHKYYHKNGRVSYLYGMKEGDYHGIYKKSDVFGHLLKKGNYYKDELEGEYYTMNKLGDTLSKKYYRNGDLEGTIYYNDIDGNLSYINTYSNGYIQKSIGFDDKGMPIDTSIIEQGSGIVNYYHPNRVLNVRLNFSCGLVTGNTVHFNGLSEKVTEGNYLRGNKDGVWTWYGLDGIVSTTGGYIKDDKHGRWLYYHENGTLRSVEHFYHGEKVGNDTSYHDNGKMYIVEHHRDGEKHGEATYYNLTEEIYMIKEYFEGDVISVYIRNGGEIANKTELKNGNGEITTYYGNGKKAFSGVYKNGVYDGELLVYHSNGTLWKKLKLVDGDLVGEYFEYHLNGQLSEITHYLYDEKHGLNAHYDESGRIMWEVNYKLDDKHGQAKYYKAGKPERNVEYYEDEILFEY